MRRIVAAVYDRRTDELSEWTQVGKARMDELLKRLKPSPRKPPDIVFPPPKPKPTPWYEKRWGQVVILGGSGVALTVLGLIANSLSGGTDTPTSQVECIGFSCP
jgi:hypothetical protein